MKTRELFIVIIILIAKTIFSERIMDNKDSTVIDKKTGLTWEICVERECSNYDYFDAKERCDTLNKAGKKWRLPTKMELVISYNYEENSFITPIYENTDRAGKTNIDIWSSTGAEKGDRYTLFGWSSKTSSLGVNCVSGQIIDNFFIDNKNGTVTDKVFKLMWQKCSIGQDNNYLCSGEATKHTWEDASKLCKNLKLEGKKWRLPTVIELQTIVDYKRFTPWINSRFFPNTHSNAYWSSSMLAQSTNSAWLIEFGTDYMYTGNKPYDYYVRCVTDP